MGGVVIKKFLNEILQEELAPIRKRREELLKNKNEIYHILYKGRLRARKVAAEKVEEVKNAMGINYFDSEGDYNL